MRARGTGPGSDVEPLGGSGVNSEPVRPIHVLRKWYRLPVLPLIARAIDGTVARVSETAALGAARQHDVESSVRSLVQPPGERLLLSDPLILQRPGLSTVCALVDSASESSHIQDASIRRAIGIKQDVGSRRFLHSGVRFLPGLASILAAADSALVIQHGVFPPHLGTRQVVGIAVDAPDAVGNFRIKNNPVGGVQP